MVASERFAKGAKSPSSPPYQKGVEVPARQAYSHSASLGSVNSAPVSAESQAQNSIARRHDTRTTGCRGSFMGQPRSPWLNWMKSPLSRRLSCRGSKRANWAFVTSVRPIQKGRSIAARH